MPHQGGWSSLLSSINGHLNSTHPERPKRGFISYAWEQDASQYGFLLLGARTNALTLADIPALPCDATYIKTQVNTKDRLYYLYHKDRTTLTLIDITLKKAEELKKLDPTAGIINQHKHLERHELQIINDHLGHNQMEKNKELQTWIKTLQEDLQAAAMEEVFLDIKNMHGELKNTMRTNIQHSDIIFFICNPRFKERFSEGGNTGLLVISMPQSKSTQELENDIKRLELPYQNVYIQANTGATTTLYYKNAWGLQPIDVTPSLFSELDAAITKPAEHKLLSPIELQRITAITGHAHNNLVFEVHTVLEEKRRRPSLNVMWLLQAGLEAKSVPDGLKDSPLFKIRGPYNQKRFTGFIAPGLLDKICGTQKDTDYRQLLYRHYLSDVPAASKLFGREQELKALRHQIKRKAISYLVGETGAGTSTLATHFANTVHHPDTPGTHFPLVRYLPVGSEEAWVTLVSAFAKELGVPTHKWWDTLLTLPTKWLLIVDSGSIRIGWEPIFKSSAYQHRLLRVQQPSIESPNLITLSPLPETARLQMLKHYLGSHDADSEQALVVKYFGSLQNLMAAINYIKKSPWLDVTRFLKYTLDVPHEPVQLAPKQLLIQDISNEPIDDASLPDVSNQSKWQVLKAQVKHLTKTRALTVGVLHTTADSGMAEKLRDDLQDCGITIHMFQTTPFPIMDALIIVATPNFKPQCSPELELAITDLPQDTVYPLITSGDFGSAVPRFLGAYLVAAIKDGYEKALLALEPLGIISAICGFKEGHSYEQNWTYYRLSNLPTLDQKLIGRTQTLTDIKRLLESQEELLDAKLVAITGMGGFGKSSVVLMYGHKYKDQYDFIRVLNSEGAAIISSLLSLASDLGIEIRGKAIHEILPQLYTALDKIPRYLLIFDNVETFEQLKPYLPVAKAGQHTLVTSRDNASWPKKIEFKEFTPAEAQEFLQRELNATSEELAEELGRLPLALNTAAAFIKEQRKQDAYTIAQYLVDYRSKKTTSATSAVFTSLQLALPKIEAQSPDALNLLRYCAFLSPEHLAPEWLAHDQLLGTMPRAYDALTVVANFSMLTVKDYELEMHRLMQKAIRESITLSPEQILEDYLLPLTEAIRTLYPQEKSKAGDYALIKQLIPHMVWLQEHIQAHKALSDAAQLKNDRADAFLLDCLGDAHGANGDFVQQSQTLKESLTLKSKCYGAEHPEYLKTLHALATAYGSLGNYQEQSQCLEEVIQIYKHCRELDNWKMAYHDTLANLIKAYELLGGTERDKIYTALTDVCQDIKIGELTLSTLQKFPATSEQKDKVLPALIAAIKGESMNEQDDILLTKHTCEDLYKLELSQEQKDKILLALIAATKDKNERVRYLACYALPLIISILSVEQKDQVFLATLAVTNDDEVRDPVCTVWKTLELSPKQKDQVLPFLITIIQDKHSSSTYTACDTLTTLKLSPEQIDKVLPALLVAMKHDAGQSCYFGKRPLQALGELALSAEQKNYVFSDLCEAMNHENDGVSIQGVCKALAALKLSPEQKDRILPALIVAMSDENGDVRQSAYELMDTFEFSAEQKDKLLPALITRLLAATEDEDYINRFNRIATLNALNKLNPSTEQTDNVLQKLIIATHDDNQDIRRAAYCALPEIKCSPEQKERVFLTLLAATKDENVEIRYIAYNALANLARSEHKDQVLIALIQATEDKASKIRLSALQSLAKCDLSLEQKEKFFEALLVAITDEDKSHRFYACLLLHELQFSPEQQEQSFPALFAATQDSYGYVRSFAWRILAKFELSTEQKTQIFPVLLMATNDKDAKCAACEILDTLTCSPEQKDQIFSALLRVATTDEDQSLRASTYKYLAEFDFSPEQKHQVLSALLAAIKDKDKDVRKTVCQALITLKLSSEQKNMVLPVLLVAVKDEDKNVRQAICKALAIHALSPEQIDKILPALLKATKDENADVGRIVCDVGRIACQVLGALTLSSKQKDGVLPTLLAATKNEDQRLIEAACQALAALELSPEQRDHVFLNLISEINNANTKIRRAACQALAALELSSEQREQVFLNLLAATKDENQDTREAACAALAKLELSLKQTNEALPALVAATKDENRDVKLAACKALAKLDSSPEQTDKILSALIVATKDKDVYVSREAYKTLGTLNLSPEQKDQVLSILLAATALVATGDTNWWIKEGAYQALDELDFSEFLSEQKNQVFTALLAATKDGGRSFEPAYCALTSLTLSLEQTEKVIQAATAEGNNSTQRTAAYQALGKLKLSAEQITQCFTVLLTASQRGDDALRTAACQTLVALELSSEQKEKVFSQLLIASRSTRPIVNAGAKEALAILYGRSGESAKKLECLEQALKIKSVHYGVRHEKYAQTLTLLANYYVDVGNLYTALTHFAKALSILKKEYGIKHTFYKDCLEQQQQAQEKLAIIHTGVCGTPIMLLRSSRNGTAFGRKDEVIEASTLDDSLHNLSAQPDVITSATVQSPSSARASGFFSSSVPIGAAAETGKADPAVRPSTP